MATHKKKPGRPRRRRLFNQSEVSAAVKGVTMAGYPVARVRVSKAGEIVVEIGKATVLNEAADVAPLLDQPLAACRDFDL